jgi:flagellar basal body-associated protein FliL
MERESDGDVMIWVVVAVGLLVLVVGGLAFFWLFSSDAPEPMRGPATMPAAGPPAGGGGAHLPNPEPIEEAAPKDPVKPEPELKPQPEPPKKK